MSSVLFDSVKKGDTQPAFISNLMNTGLAALGILFALCVKGGLI